MIAIRCVIECVSDLNAKKQTHRAWIDSRGQGVFLQESKLVLSGPSRESSALAQAIPLPSAALSPVQP